MRDKDGVHAAVQFARMAAAVKAAGAPSLLSHLEGLYERYGYFVSNNGYVFVDAPAKTEAIFARLRNGGAYTLKMGDLHVVGVRDLTGEGWDSDAPGGRPLLPTSTGAHMITYRVRTFVSAPLSSRGIRIEARLLWSP